MDKRGRDEVVAAPAPLALRKQPVDPLLVMLLIRQFSFAVPQLPDISIMSAYTHQMEREISFLSQTTPSARTSELGSYYEPGFAISGFSAMILIGALVVAGVSLLALLTALAIMLQSCQSKSAGILDLVEYKSPNDNMCEILAMHAELNELSVNEIPLNCKEDASRHIRTGQYAKDFEFVIGLVVVYFSSFKPQADGLDIILIDADDLFPSISRGNSFIHSSSIVKADTIKQILMLRLYKTLQVQGWQIVLVSRKPVEDRNATLNYLVSSGYTDWLLLIMRSEMYSSGYIFRQGSKMEEEGKRIVGIVSSKMDAVGVAFSGTRIFKLPSHVYFHF